MIDLLQHLNDLSDFVLTLFQEEELDEDQKMKMQSIDHRLEEQFTKILQIEPAKNSTPYKEAVKIAMRAGRIFKSVLAHKKTVDEVIQALEHLIEAVDKLLEPYLEVVIAQYNGKNKKLKIKTKRRSNAGNT
jgi:hypothetical protein